MKKLISISLVLLSFTVTAQQFRVVGTGKKVSVVPGAGSSSSPGTTGAFTFSIAGNKHTSAAVYKNDTILVTTLWSNDSSLAAGTYTGYWDGKDDYGNTIASPDSTYKVKVLTSAVRYTWQGTIGNTSDNMTGSSKHRGYYNGIKCLAFSGSYGYYCTGYSEASPSFAKFNTRTPNKRINITVETRSSTCDVEYVCTDGARVYWGGLDGNSVNNTFVFATNNSNDAYVRFANGTNYTPRYRSELNTISYLNAVNSAITGLAVQHSANYLFVARAGLNNLYVINKHSGAAVSTISFANIRGLCIDGGDNLWVLYSTNTIQKFSVDGSGKLTSMGTISGSVSPLSISYGNGLLAVCEGGAIQVVKFYNNSSFAYVSTLGTAGGYTTDATVSNSKFYFTDLRGDKKCFVAWQPDNSYWVNDFGNNRVQHYNSSNTYQDRVMFMGATYSCYVDRGNIKKVYAEYLEFSVDYSVQTLTGTSGWSLTKNWGANITSSVDDFGKIRYTTTLSNGRVYGLVRKGRSLEVIEYVQGATIRFTGVYRPLGDMIAEDGNILSASRSGGMITYRRYALTGFDGNNNPQWSVPAEVLGTAFENYISGNPVSGTFWYNPFLMKLVLFQPASMANTAGPVYHKGYHLALMQQGASNRFTWQTEKSTPRYYGGSYPPAGWFEVGNIVNNAAGSEVMMVDSNIITGYHGEFWKNGQTNKYNHYHYSGLAIGQFGTTRSDVGTYQNSNAGMAGNALTPIMVRAGDSMYLYHGDESDHSAIHRWKISGLKTITIQTITINFPSAYTPSAFTYKDLMAGLPWHTGLANNTAGWTRSPATDILTNQYLDYWKISTTEVSLPFPVGQNDVFIVSVQPSTSGYYIQKDLGTNNVTKNWKITGELAFGGSINQAGLRERYFDILDDAGLIITRMYITGSYEAPSYLYCNKVVMATAGDGSLESRLGLPKPFEISVVGTVVTFKYAGFKNVITTRLNGLAHWQKPTTLKISFHKIGSRSQGQTIYLKDLKLFKDY